MGEPSEDRGTDSGGKEDQRTRLREIWERQLHDDNVQIVSALDRIVSQLNADEKKEERDHRKKAVREYLTIFLVFATVITAGIGDYFFWEQKREMAQLRVAEDRAWVNIGRPEVPMTMGRTRVDVTLPATNVGKSPAVKIDYHTNRGPYDWDGEHDHWPKELADASFADTVRQECAEAKKKVGFTILWPTTPANVYVSYEDTNWIAKIFDRKAILAIYGCVNYSTILGEAHYTTFCTAIRVNPLAQRGPGGNETAVFSACPYGNGVDDEDDEKKH